MRNKTFVDCFVLMGTALFLRGGKTLPQMSRPLFEEFSTTFVNLTFTVYEFNIDPTNMEFEITALLGQNWVDSRLKPDIETRRMAVMGQIWKPKILIINGIEITDDDKEDSIFWRGYGDEGKVLLQEKVQIRGKCTENFENFPFDSQFCQVKFGSYRFPKDEVELFWSPTDAVTILENFKSSEFALKNVTTFLETDPRPSGNFSTAIVQFHIQRIPYHYIICTIIPCIVMFFINYVTLYLNLGDRTKRFNLNFSTFIFHVAFYYNSTCLTYSVPYFKALDLFTSVCGSFSGLQLLESILIDRFCEDEDEDFRIKKKSGKRRFPEYLRWLEFGMKLAVPVFFILFMLLFMTVFCTDKE